MEIENDILFHYTSVYSFNEIFKNRKIWASDCRFLNDSLELRRSIDLLLNECDEKVKEAMSWACRLHDGNNCHCIFSLSSSPKVLSQWRSYADDGKGVAIGFGRKYITYSEDATCKPLLIDCVYRNHQDFIKSIIKSKSEQIEDIQERYNKARGLNGFMEDIENAPQSLNMIFQDLLKIKNEAFEEEKESRLIFSVSRNEIKTRVSNGVIMPYFEYNFCDKGDESFLSILTPQIWLGPKCDKRNLHTIKMLKYLKFYRDDSLMQYDCGYI